MKVFLYTPIFIILFIINTTIVMSQKYLSGEYIFHKMELVSAFLFTKDGHFEFYYSYGASDRMAKGSYSIHGDTLQLHSDKIAGQDFEILSQSKNKENSFKIKVKGPNEVLISAVICHCKNGNSLQSYQSDTKGIIIIPDTNCEELYLEHKYYPDYPTLIKDKLNSNNRFEVEMKSSLEQFSFKGIDFIIKGNTLTCLPNYLLPFKGIEYTKSN